jgi:ABC-2 type transport system permease protein
MKPFLAMIKANLKMNVRNRTALFWNLVFPALFIIIFGTIFNDADNISLTIGVAGTQSTYMDSTVAAMKSDDALKIKEGTQEEELKKLSDGDRDAVVIFGPPADGSGQPTVTIYYDETRGPTSRVAVNVVSQYLYGATQTESPIAVTTQPVNSTSLSYIEFLVPGILAMSLMNSGVIGLSTAFVIYREKGILRRIKVTPFHLTSFVLARILSQLLIALAQMAILIGLSVALFGLNIHGNPALLIVEILIGALAFLAIGFAISGISKNVETAAAFGNLVTFPMLFLSGVFFEINTAPAWLQPITKILPLSYLVDALRETMSRGKGLSAVWTDLLFLLATFVIGMAIAVRFFRWDAQGTT